MAALFSACGVDPPIESAPPQLASRNLTEDAARAEPVNSAHGEDPPPLFDARLLPSSFGAKEDGDTLDIEVESFLDRPAEIVFLLHALDETQRVVKQLSAGAIEARERRTATLRIADLALGRDALAVSGVLSLYPILLTETGARTPPLDRALRVSYHPAAGRLITYDSAERASVHRGGALSEVAYRAAGSTGAEVVAGYRGGQQAIPAHDGAGEPDPDHDVAAEVVP